MSIRPEVADRLDRVLAVLVEPLAYADAKFGAPGVTGLPSRIKVQVELEARASWSDTITLTEAETAEYAAAKDDEERAEVLEDIAKRYSRRGEFDVLDADSVDIDVFSVEVAS